MQKIHKKGKKIDSMMSSYSLENGQSFQNYIDAINVSSEMADILGVTTPLIETKDLEAEEQKENASTVQPPTRAHLQYFNNSICYQDNLRTPLSAPTPASALRHPPPLIPCLTSAGSYQRMVPQPSTSPQAQLLNEGPRQ